MTALDSLGVDEGDAVALLMRNDIAFLEASLAIGRLGAYAVPLNRHAKQNEIRAILLDSAAKAVIAHGDLARASGDAGVPTVIVRTPQEIVDAYGLDAGAHRVHACTREWESWLSAHPPFTTAPRRSRGSIVYTSGTTGVPKGIQREPCATVDQEQQLLKSLYETFGIRPGVRALICGPLYHSMQTANMRAAFSALGEDGVMVIEPRFDPERFLRSVSEHRVTQILMVPIMFVRLLRLAQSVRRRYDLSSLEWVVHAAAPCPPDLKQRMIEWFGPVINEFYALSETGAVTLIGPADALRKPGSVGRALPGCIVKVLGYGAQELPPGAEGEIAVLNPGYPDFTYRNRPEARAALDRGGLVATGDIGYVDADGFLFLCGRRSDMVISGGVNLFPVEIEEVLLACPGVADCAVFGIPDEEYGEVLAAHIEPLRGVELNEAEVRAYLRERLPGLKVPKIIRFDEALPREDSGKIFKRWLREAHGRTR